jgi:ABC-type multidrug transport system ATPase subunit
MLALTIDRLSKTYPNGTRALHDVSLTIASGMFGLLGPNGAGKSTLMRTIATLQDPDRGTITLGDIDVVKDKERLRRVLRYLPQEFGVYPKVTAEELLTHFAILKGITNAKQRKDEVLALLQQTNLFDVRKKMLGSFSGGMKQRFGIAQALLGNPKLVIVDEPTAGLDPEERARFNNLLGEIGEQVVVILSTHIVGDVSDLCSRMAVINKGELLLVGEPQALTQALGGRIWCKAIAKESLAEHTQAHAVISNRRFAGRTLIHVYADAKPTEGFEAVAPDLEDVYFSAIKGHLSLTPARAA